MLPHAERHLASQLFPFLHPLPSPVYNYIPTNYLYPLLSLPSLPTPRPSSSPIRPTPTLSFSLFPTSPVAFPFFLSCSTPPSYPLPPSHPSSYPPSPVDLFDILPPFFLSFSPPTLLRDAPLAISSHPPFPALDHPLPLSPPFGPSSFPLSLLTHLPQAIIHIALLTPPPLTPKLPPPFDTPRPFYFSFVPPPLSPTPPSPSLTSPPQPLCLPLNSTPVLPLSFILTRLPHGASQEQKVARFCESRGAICGGPRSSISENRSSINGEEVCPVQ